jgi:hypothetical protein
MNKTKQNIPPGEQRWVLLRDIGVLQAKLLIDGLRDLILVPASLIAGLVSLVTAQDGVPGLQFYRLLAWGKQTETWINLFGAAKNSPEEIRSSERFGDHDIDALVGRLETIVVDEVNRGGVTKQAKERFEKILDAVQRKNRRP